MNYQFLTRRAVIAATGSALAFVSYSVTLRSVRAQSAVDEGAADMFIGNGDAPITMVMYESLMCHHCADFHNETLPRIKEKYVEKGLLKVVFREFPGTRENPFPAVPVMMARCLGKDRYFAMKDMLYKDQEKWMKANTGEQFVANVAAYGRLAGMSKKELDACLKNEAILRAMSDRWREGVAKFGLKGTPHFVIGDKTISGNRPLVEFEQVLIPLIEKLPKKN